jgi:hypothetical protein
MADILTEMSPYITALFLIAIPWLIILHRTGLHKAMVLLLIIPYLGGLILMLNIAYSSWPKLPEEELR